MTSTNIIRLWIIATILILAVVGLSTSEDPETNQGNASTINETSKKPKEISLIPEINLEPVCHPFLVVMWILCALLVKNAYHMMPLVGKYLPESCLLILVGLVIGGFFRFMGAAKPIPLGSDLIFVYMLPPIILNTGYSVPSRLFFDHLGTILVFAVLGTIWNSIAIGLSLYAAGQAGVFTLELPLTESLLFATIISAIDPVAVLAIFEEIHVNDILYIIVVGESVLNDAVTVVLYYLCKEFLEFGSQNVELVDYLSGFAKFLISSLGGTLIGLAFGFLTSFVTRFTNYARDVEIIYIFVMSYLSYLCAHLFEWSGILAIIFCAMTMKSYVKANISQKSLTSIKYDMKSLGSTCEAVIFILLGVNTVLIDQNAEANWIFTLMTILSCLVVRTIGVVVLANLVNQFRLYKLDLVEIFVLSYGGLRGAVAYALVETVDKTVPQAKLFKTTTLILVYFTVFLQGITIKPLVKYLEVKQSARRKKTMNERVHEILMDYILVGIEDVLGHVGYFKLRDKFKQYNNRFIRPFLVRDQQVQEPKILETYSRLAKKDALTLMTQNVSNLNLAETGSMDIFFRNFVANRRSVVLGSGFNKGAWQGQRSGRHLAEAKMHHLRPLEPRNRVRRSLSQDQLDVSEPPFRHRTPVHIRRIFSESVADSEEEDSKISEIDELVKDAAPEPKSSTGCEPTAVDKQLPWRRRDDTPAVRSEFPPWAENKDYVCYYSPTNTFLGALNNEPTLPSVVDFFNQPSGDDYEQLSTCSCSLADSRSSSVVLNITEEDSVSAKNK